MEVPHLSTVSGGGLSSSYKAVQFHLHWGTEGGPGSEHTIDGEQYPMEVVTLFLPPGPLGSWSCLLPSDPRTLVGSSTSST